MVCAHIKKWRGKEIDHAHGPPPSNPNNMEDKRIIHFMLEVSVGVLVCLLRLRLLLLDPPATTHKGRGPARDGVVTRWIKTLMNFVRPLALVLGEKLVVPPDLHTEFPLRKRLPSLPAHSLYSFPLLTWPGPFPFLPSPLIIMYVWY